jgi:transcription antitermination factor NusG
MPFWSVARCNRALDSLAVASITTLGYEVFWPRTRTRLGLRWITQPLFAGYLFVRFDNDDRWRPVERALGVVCLLKTGNVPSRLPDVEVATLLQRSDRDGIVRLNPSPPVRPVRKAVGFAAGAPVTIMGGPFGGFQGLHSGMSSAERQIVLLTVLGAQRQAAVSPNLIVPARA